MRTSAPTPTSASLGKEDPGVLLHRLRRSRLAGNTTALYAAHLLGLLVPLLTVPYLARVLRPEGWGLVVFAQSLGAWTALLLEYGFDLWGTRAVARSKKTPEALPEIVAGIQGAKALAALAVLGAGTAFFFAVPILHAHPILILWTLAFALTRGFSPAWYFFGQERMRWPAMVEAGAKVVAALGVFVWVQAPGDEWKVLALQALAGAAALAWLTGWMYRELPFRLPALLQSVRTLKAAAGVFLFRSASGLYLQANPFILGLLTTPQVVAFFGGAEKVIRAAINLFHPLSQALFPRLSHLVANDPRRASRLLRMGLLAMLGGGIVMGVAAATGAPLLVRVLLGPGYEAAIPVLRVLSLLPVLIALGTVFGIQWALPAGLERPFCLLVLAAGVLNVGLAVVLAPRFGAMGMAVSVLLAELLTVMGLLALFRARGGRFFPLRIPGEGGPA
jgi:polysaccharide transporter, PST family